LHQAQLLQLIPGYQCADGVDDDHALSALAEQMAAEDVQLYYQIAVAGRRDLTLAPDARTGFEMALLRMLAFRPEAAPGATPGPSRATAASHSASAPSRPQAVPKLAAPARDAPVAAAPAAPAREQVAVPPGSTAAAPPAPGGDGLPDWDALIARAALHGPLRMLAQNAVLRAREGQTLVLALQPTHLHMAVEPMVSQMAQLISTALGETVQLRFVSVSSRAAAAQTPAARAAQARATAQAHAEAAIDADPLVQSLKREFGARVVPQSVKPLVNESGAM
jgi:DNA polymerase-3 subunit gamma/tau